MITYITTCMHHGEVHAVRKLVITAIVTSTALSYLDKIDYFMPLGKHIANVCSYDVAS